MQRKINLLQSNILAIESSNRVKKTFSKKLNKTVNDYFNDKFYNSLDLLSDLDEFVESNRLTPTQQADLRKLLSIFFLGQIIGLPTLNSVLQYHGIKSNSHQICYKNLCNSLKNKDIHHIFSTLFEKELGNILKDLSQKDPSAWSRETITVVLDDSVFRT